MKDACKSLDRLRASCDQEASRPHVCEELTQRIAASLDVQASVVSILGKARYCYRRGNPSWPIEIPSAVRICDIFHCMDIDALELPDARADGVFARHPGVLHSPFMRSFAGARIRVNGTTVGTMCVFDARPDAVSMPLFRDLRRLVEAVVHSLHARGQRF